MRDFLLRDWIMLVEHWRIHMNIVFVSAGEVKPYFTVLSKAILEAIEQARRSSEGLSQEDRKRPLR